MPRKSTDRPPPAAPPAARPERLALNLFDLGALPAVVREMLAGRVDARKEAVVWVDRDRLDETAVPLTGPLLDAACLVDVVRAEAARAGAPVRAYLCRARAWARLPAAAVLTVVEGGKPRLADAWFPGAVESAPYRPPPPRAVTF